MAEAQDTHSLAAHKIADRLRTTLTGVAQVAEEAKTIIIHGPTGTGKSTVVPWEAMRWLEEHCADSATTPGMVLCSQQRRKVTISLAEEVRKRHGMVGQAVVGFHVSKNRSAGPATRLMYTTEAIGVYALINNRATPSQSLAPRMDLMPFRQRLWMVQVLEDLASAYQEVSSRDTLIPPLCGTWGLGQLASLEHLSANGFK